MKFDDDDQLEEDEEETLVYVEFESTSGPDAFCSEKLQLDMIGLDTEHPIMRVNGRHYVGTYEDAIGTCMFFDKENDLKIDDPVFDKPSALRYYEKSRKILKMKRVFVNPRWEILGDSNHPKCIPNMETIKEAGVPPKYMNDALSVWEKMRNKVIGVRNDYLEKQEKRKEKRQRGIEPDSESDEDNYYVSMFKSKVENGQNKDTNIQELDKTISQLSNDTVPSTSKDNFSDVSFENDKVTDESEDQDSEDSLFRDEQVLDDEEIDLEVGAVIETSAPGTSTTPVNNEKLGQNIFEKQE